MTKTPSFALLAAFLVNIVVPTSFAASYSDVQGTPYENAVSALAAAGVIGGYSDGTMRPYNALNRAEALKIILRAQGSLAAQADSYARQMPPIPLFPDVNQAAWYAPYVEVAYRSGIVKGYPDGYFRPDSPVSTEEATAMLLRTFGENGSGVAYASTQSFENRPDQWYTPFVNVAIAKNLAMKNAVLIPGRSMTRGQLFDMTYRLREVKTKQLVAWNGTEPVGSAVPTVPSQNPGTGPKRALGVPAASLPQYASTLPFAITIPSLGIKDLPIIHPTDSTTSKGVLEILYSGVGHLFAYPGEGDKIMIYGHSSGYPWDVSQYTKIFRTINQMNIGDRAYVTYNNQVFVYEVTFKNTVKVDDAEPFQPDGNGEELILYTCWPPDTVDERYLVHMVPVNVAK